MGELVFYTFGVFSVGLGLGIVIGVGQRVFLQHLVKRRERPHKPHLGCCQPVGRPTKPMRVPLKPRVLARR